MVTEKFYVGYSEINEDLKLSNVGMMNYFQDITTIHGASIGDSLKTTDYAWFVTAYKVKIFGRPEYENWFKLNTWSRGIKGFSASREFEILDENGNLQVKAISNWIRVNKITQKIERISGEVADGYGEEDKTNFDDKWLVKLTELEDYDYVKDFTADKNYIDFHKHVNNVAYLKIAGLILPENAFDGKESNEFEIMFRNSIKLGEHVKCFVKEIGDGFNITIKSEDLSELKAIIRLYK